MNTLKLIGNFFLIFTMYLLVPYFMALVMKIDEPTFKKSKYY